MPFEKLISQGNIIKHKASKAEIADLGKLIERDLKDSSITGLSEDRRFAIAYNAVLQCGTMIMHALGYRARGEAHHYSTFEFLREALGKKCEDLIDYFDACRSKRNRTDYDAAGEISETEVIELLDEAKNFYKYTQNWISQNFPQLL
jgi:uncharacterized protein (UPF0332 family)